MPNKTRLAVLFALGAVLSGLSPGLARAQSCFTWQKTAHAPDARNQQASAFDSARGVTVIFGGFNGGYNSETWEYNGVEWDLRPSAGGPSARIQSSMAYDSDRGVCVLFGGEVFGPGDDTWEWDGAAWTYRVIAGPPGRWRHVMAYDSTRHRTVLYGGYDGNARFDDTWEFDGTAWSQVALAGPRPAARSTPCMAFDASRGVCVLFGGYVAGVGYSNDTWEWNGTTWTQRVVAGPSARALAQMSYDAARQRIVMVGGSDGNTELSDTWEWDGTTWTQRATNGISPRASHSMVYDSVRSRSVVVGGSIGTDLLGDVQEWNGTTWAERLVGAPPGRYGGGMSYDSVRDTTVLFGGEWDGPILQGDMWERTPVGWTKRSVPGPTARTGHAMVFDPVRNETLLFGGFTLGAPGGDETWVWNGTTWTQRMVAGPSARYTPGAAFDSARGVVVLFGGHTPTGDVGDTWEWNGTAWTQRLIPGPSARVNSAMAYDPQRGVCVLFGGGAGGGPFLSDTWEYNGTAWTQRAVTGPSGRFGHTLVYDPVRHTCVLFGGQTAGGESAEQWEFDGTAWTQRTTSGPTARLFHHAVYDNARGLMMLYGGRPATGVNGETWHLSAEAPSVSSDPSPQTACAGSPASFAVAAGGTGPFTYRWRHNGVDLTDGGGITGATTDTLSIASVVPADAGSYDCVITTDCGSATSAAAALTVNAGPSLSQNPDPASACSGQNASFAVTASGAAPLTYQWRRNGVDLGNGGGISGATSATLQLTGVSGAAAGAYDCVVTNTCGSTTSSAATLTVNIAPAFTQSPAPASACDGQPASFTVAAAGTEAISYQWRRNGVNLGNGGGISGATSPTLSIAAVSVGSAGNYDCVATNICGSATSTAAALTVDTAPSISQSPTGTTLCAGSPLSLSVTASGSGTLAYQWRRNGVNLANGGGISGATSASLSIAAIAEAQAGDFDCVVTNTCGSATSAAATVVVQAAVSFSQNPSDATRCDGQSVTFSVTASGAGPLAYQWRKNGVAITVDGRISGAATANLNISSIDPLDAAAYDCVVTGACGSVTSSAATLTVQNHPVVSQEPAAAEACPGQPATFTIAATGTGPLTYQWRRNGVDLSNGGGISGATTASLSLAAVAAGDAGTFDCVVTGVCGSTTSTAATLTVNQPPQISADPQPATLCAAQPASFTVSATGSGTLAYQWRRNGVNVADGNGVSGATTASLSIAGVAIADAGSYDCVITNTCGSATSNAATLVVDSTPTVGTHPAPASVCAGQPGGFSVAAAGTEPLSYQWRRNGVNVADGNGVSGATTASLSIAGVSTGDAGSYDCVVTNSCGSATSNAATLAVGVAPIIDQSPASLARCEGLGATFSVVASGSPASYQWRRNGVDLADGAGISGATTASLSIAAVAAGNAGSYDCVVTNTCGSTTSAAATLTVDAPPSISQSPAGATHCAGQPATFSVVADGTGPLTYQWRRNGVDLSNGAGICGPTAATLSLAAVAAADAGAYDCIVTNACASATSSAATLTVDVSPAIGTQPAAATHCAGQPASFSVVASGTAPFTYQWRRNGVDLSDGAGISGSTTATLSLTTIAAGDAGSYDCIVTNVCGSTTSNTAALAVDVAPTIGTQPAAATHCAGQPASFSVVGSGTGPLSYQWRKDTVNLADGAGISGATTATLSLAAIAAGDAGSYDCVVTNACGSATSNTAALVVDVAPSIGTQPAGAAHCVGQPATFSVVASGTGPLSYQWRKDTVNLADGAGISGATTATLNLDSVSAADAGSYDCIITNACASATSNAATLTVQSGPSIGTQPASATHCAGQPATFAVVASGSLPLTYQWRRNGVDLADGAGVSGATTATLSLAAVAAADAGSYDCVVTNTCGGATSSAATLTVDVGPAIGTQPAPATHCAGQSAAFSVSATGTAPLAYQWRRNGVDLADGAGISGSTTATLSLSAVSAPDAGSYDCVVTNACGSATSNTAALAVDAPTAITTQPIAVTQCVSQGAGFSVAASGAGPLNYQWRRNSVNLSNGPGISGAASPILSFTSLQLSDAGSIDCVVTGACGSATTESVALTVNPPTSISQQPAPVTVCQNANASFSVSASGAGTLVYQWRRNATPLSDGGSISGSATAALSITGVLAADAGSYDCLVTGTCGPIASSAAALTVNIAPVISQPPAAQAQCAGQSATLTVAATGTEPFTYQWRKDGAPLSDGAGISGAGTASLQLTGLIAGSAGAYDCVVTNTCGSATSAAAALTINTPPAIATPPAALTRCVGAAAAFSVSATGTEPFTYQWRKDGSNITDGPGISGASTATLTLDAVAISDAASYDCVVTNPCGSLTSSAADLTVQTAPSLITQPQTAAHCVGQPAGFSVAAVGSGPLTYQWRHDGENLADGANIVGSATPTLTIAAVATADAGSYDCVVTGPCGSVTSSGAPLTVNTSPFISGNPDQTISCTGQPAVLTVAATGSGPLSYQWRRDGTPVANGSGFSGATTATLTISSAVPGSLGMFDCVVTNACGSATSTSAPVAFNAAPTITEQPAGHKRCAGQPEVMTVAASGTEPMTFQWKKDGVNLVDGPGLSGATTDTLVISSAAAADEGSYVCVVTNSCGSTPSAAALLSVSQPPVMLTQPQPADRCVNQSVSFTVSANGVAPLTYQWRRNGVNLVNGGRFAGVTAATLNVSALAVADSGDYDCVVTNLCGSITSSTAALSVRSAPQIAQHPVPQTPCGGGDVSFSVTATGSSPLAYQWRKDGVDLVNGGSISGATTATLTITGVTDSDNGSYDCVVTNTCGSATCSPAALTASPGPSFSQQPLSADVFVGSTAAFSATASGPGTLTYQWQRNGVDLADGGRILGATTASLTITGAVLSDAGSYTLVVTSSTCGAATSQPATLAVFCLADFDRNGSLTPADVSLFVSTWFADLQNGTLVADLDHNGFVEPADVSAFVAAWFAAVTAGGC